MWFGFQFNLSDSSDDDLYRLDLDSGKLSLYSWDHVLVHPKKIEQGVPWVRLDANAKADANTDADADANRSKTICQPPLKGGRHN